MNKLTSITVAALLLARVASLHAAEVANCKKAVPVERMQQVYDVVKTPWNWITSTAPPFPTFRSDIQASRSMKSAFTLTPFLTLTMALGSVD